MKFSDGIINLVNKLANWRSAQSTNQVQRNKVSFEQMNAIFKTGIGSKIIRLKTAYALNDTLQFKTEADKEFYNKKLQRAVKKASKYQLAFGRGIIVINTLDDLSQPLREGFKRYKLDVFSGDMITVPSVELDLHNTRYMKPKQYNVNGVTFHHSRVIDFVYQEPTERDLPNYNYGGISEFELIYNQIINDGVVERAGASIVEKNATVFHKVTGFKQALSQNKENDILKFYESLAQLRSIYGDGIIDKEDDVISVSQSLTNLQEVDNITLRRLAMVTGIPLALLIGENVKGLGSTGDQERTAFQDTIDNYQFDYLADPILELCNKFGIKDVEFKENQGGTALERIEYETKVIDNAVKLDSMGEDHRAYMKEHGIKLDDGLNIFKVDNATETY